MLEAESDIVDVVIVGAGIGGLVCGCYLAQAGMKVLIAERHNRPGGYCTSFRRKEFLFDAAAHSFGSYRDGGIVRTVLREVGLDGRISIIRHDPSDQIITPKHTIGFWSDTRRTIQELEHAFPRERRIGEFISFLANPTPVDMASLRRKSLKNLLDHFFSDEELKSILSFQVFVNGGLPPSLMTAFAGVKLFTEIIIDGGYYPVNGMQALADAFAARFRELGGILFLSSPVRSISAEHGQVTGVVLESRKRVKSRYVISDCDAKLTFLHLIGRDKLDQSLLSKLDNMTPSLSMFILYLGMDQYREAVPQAGTTLWYLPHFDLDMMYRRAKHDAHVDMTKYLCRVSPKGDCIVAMTNTSYKSEEYWRLNRETLEREFINIIQTTTMPGLTRHIVYKESATPNTLYKYTLNDQGATYGWESLITQSFDQDFRRPRCVSNLYLTGHWTTYGQGIAGVAYLGSDLAKSIIKKERRGLS